jgi:hypothetical protein
MFLLLINLLVLFGEAKSDFFCKPTATGSPFLDRLTIFWMQLNFCTKCQILRFKKRAGLNDISALSDDEMAYTNIE